MSVDGGLRPLFHDRLREGIHWQAIETGGTGSGIPDSNAKPEDGLEFWVEFKFTSAWSVGFQPEQPGWHLTRHRRGGTTFIAVRRQHAGGPRLGDPVDELWLCEGRWVRELNRDGLKSPDITWLGVWSGGPARWDWEAIRRHLTR